jgi:hypothetical protein
VPNLCNDTQYVMYCIEQQIYGNYVQYYTAKKNMTAGTIPIPFHSTYAIRFRSLYPPIIDNLDSLKKRIGQFVTATSYRLFLLVKNANLD